MTIASTASSRIESTGASCDWTREKFTLDSSVVSDVHKTFKKMYDDGLVYRGTRLVNWCTKHQTSLSDVETESKEFSDTLYGITMQEEGVSKVVSARMQKEEAI